jgi:hypothetical protein
MWRVKGRKRKRRGREGKGEKVGRRCGRDGKTGEAVSVHR